MTRYDPTAATKLTPSVQDHLDKHRMAKEISQNYMLRLQMGDTVETRPPPFTLEYKSDFTTAEDARIKVDERKEILNYKGATRAAQISWDNLVERLHPGVMLRLTDELTVRGETVQSFFMAMTDAETDNLQGILHYMDYRRERKSCEQHLTQSASLSAEDKALLYVPATWQLPLCENAVGLEYKGQDVNELYREALKKIGFDDLVDGSLGRHWWDRAESHVGGDTVILLRLAQEIAVVEETIQSVAVKTFSSNTDHLGAMISFCRYHKTRREY